jgi:hypothetical protein
MPQQYIPTGQDWAPANAGRSNSGTAGLKAVPKTAQDLSLAKQRGLVTTEKRIGAGGNQSSHSSGIMSARKLEEADDVGTIAKVDKSLSKAIMQVCLSSSFRSLIECNVRRRLRFLSFVILITGSYSKETYAKGSSYSN